MIITPPPPQKSLCRQSLVILALGALSILHTPYAAAQTRPAHECVSYQARTLGNFAFFNLRNNCSEIIDIVIFESNPGCVEYDYAENKFLNPNPNRDPNEDSINWNLPGKYCVEYRSNESQAASGFQKCSSITLNDCGNDPDKPSLAIPLRVPSGTISLSPTGTLSVAEGGSRTLSVSLSTAPSANVTVSLSKTNADLTLSPTSLTFTTSNYSTAQPVTVNAADDDDATNDSDTITLEASGGIDAPKARKSITILDDDTPEFDLAASSISVREGAQGSFQVRLSVRPSANVTVSLTASDPDIAIDTDPDTAGNQNTLTFNLTGQTNAWNEYRTVSVSAAHDNDAYDKSAAIALSGKGGDFEGKTASLALSIVDDEPPRGRILLPPTEALTIDEGRSGSIDIRLSRLPKANVTLSPSSDNPDLVFSPASLTFTPTNGTSAQTLSVSASDDSDFTNESSTIILTAQGGIIAPPVSKEVRVIDNDIPPSGTIRISPLEIPSIAEGDSLGIEISLSSLPGADAFITLSSDNPDLTLSPTSLTFTPSNYSNAQSVLLATAEDDDDTDESVSITIAASGGIGAPPITTQARIIDDDKPSPPPPAYVYDGTLVIAPEGRLVIDEGSEASLDIRLGAQPMRAVSVLVSKTSKSLGVGFSRESMTFTPTTWNEAQTLTIVAHEDSDRDDSVHTLVFDFEGRRAIREVIVTDDDKELPKTQALALPSPGSGDSVTLRIQCKQETPCSVAFDCSAQEDGEVFEGRLPEPIPAWGALSLSIRDIQRHTGEKSWGGKGRLGCALRSGENIGSQVWTRSGNGVLVNNSAMIRSVLEGEVYRADIESIPSPDSSDESNIRIRCNSPVADCLDTAFVCYLDSGRRYEWMLGRIERLTTRHLQSEELASGIGYRWQGLGLTCEVQSSRSFTAQVLTRTGGGGALVNNSATGG